MGHKGKKRKGPRRRPHAEPEARSMVVEGLELVQHGGAVTRVLEGEYAGMRVFVRHVLPGERARVRVDKMRRGYGEGRLEELLQAVPRRVAPDCEVSSRCGGCSWRHVPEDEQSRARAGFVRNAIERAWSGPEVPIELRRPAEMLRSRARFFLSPGGLAYRSFRSRDPVVPEVCPALHPELDTLRKPLGDWLLRAGMEGASVLLLRGMEGQSDNTPEARWKVFVSVRITTRRPPGGPLFTGADPMLQRFGGLCVRGRDGEVLWAHGAQGFSWPVTVRGAQRRVRFPIGSFTQSSPDGNAALAAALGEILEDLEPKPRHALELFSGAGNLSVLWPHSLRSLTVVERDEAALDHLRENLGSPPPFPVKVCVGDISSGLARVLEVEAGRFDTVLLDPPREGARAVMPELVKLKPRHIIYVSCDPATLSRDLQVLVEGGYRPTRAIAVELFPATPHVETVVALSLR